MKVINKIAVFIVLISAILTAKCLPASAATSISSIFPVGDTMIAENLHYSYPLHLESSADIGFYLFAKNAGPYNSVFDFEWQLSVKNAAGDGFTYHHHEFDVPDFRRGIAMWEIPSQHLPAGNYTVSITAPPHQLDNMDANDFFLEFSIELFGVPSGSIQIIRVFVNEKKLTFDQPPIIENGRTLVPFRSIFEALGAEVDWNQTSQTVTAVRGSVTITLRIGDDVLVKNGQEIKLDVPAKIVGGRTLVPIRAVAESLGAEVGWDQNTRIISISE